MSSLKDLKRRLDGVLVTKQLAGAMKTVSSVKFTKINSLWTAYGKYLNSCNTLVFDAGIVQNKAEKAQKVRLYLLLSGNRGLCGGYNTELFSFFDEIAKNNADSLFITCGKKAAEHCRAKKIPVINEISVSDVPSFEEGANLCNTVRELYESGKVNEVYFVYQNHINLLKRELKLKKFLPLAGENALPGETVYYPDKETISRRIYPFYLNTAVYSYLLNCAAGVQAATLTAMRSAYKTADESAALISKAINRRRQADVTAGVIETSADYYKDEKEV